MIEPQAGFYLQEPTIYFGAPSNQESYFSEEFEDSVQFLYFENHVISRAPFKLPIGTYFDWNRMYEI